MVCFSFCKWVLVLLLLSARETSSQLGFDILLPPRMKNPVEYRLEGFDSCFKWASEHHDVISVTPEFNTSSHCSTSVLLRSISPYSGRKETTVYATDMQTGSVIRCKVFIENISIIHTCIKLELDGLSLLRIRAFESNLDGVSLQLVSTTLVFSNPHAELNIQRDSNKTMISILGNTGHTFLEVRSEQLVNSSDMGESVVMESENGYRLVSMVVWFTFCILTFMVVLTSIFTPEEPGKAERRSGALQEESPRLPPAYLEYLKETIHETPYYIRF